MAQKIRVGIIFGGRSGEHEVSLVSARGIMAAIDREKYQVLPIGITREGRWIAGGDPMRALQSGLREGHSQTAALLSDPSQPGLLCLEEQKNGLRAARLSEVDVVFPVLHGPYGEDGTVQGLLELANLAYVGAGVAASALGMDKVLQKSLFRQHGLPVVQHIAVLRRDWEHDPDGIIERVLATVGCPCFVKPANLGSSIGIGKAHDAAELPVALSQAAQYDRKILVEEAIDAREIEVSVLGNDEPMASVPGEIVPCNEFYDYAAKYIDDDSELLIPAAISPALTHRVQELAVRAFQAIDCAGMARVDFLLERDTDRVYVSELNTIPGFTPISMYPKLWQASGISFSELIDRLLELALERHRDKSRCRTDYLPG